MVDSFSLPKGPYVQSHFINRDQEINLVRAAVQDVLKGSAPEIRTIVFPGDRNMGKTWLSYHLAQEVLPSLPTKYGGRVSSLLYTFDEHVATQAAKWQESSDVWHPAIPTRSILTEQDIEGDIQDILKWTLTTLNAFGRDVKQASIVERIQWLTRHLEKEQNKVFVFLFDSISEVDRRCLEGLEQAMLAPLAEHPNVLIVMTGRPPLPLWTSTKLRVYVHVHSLDPFSIDTVKKILTEIKLLDEQRVPSAATELLRISRGNPGIVARLAYMMFEENRDLPDALDKVVDEQLNVFGDDNDSRRDARRAFEHLCVLTEPFRETEMEVMLAEKDGQPEAANEAKRIRDLLANVNLIHWEKGGFRLDESIRHLAAEYLESAARPRWTSSHRRAANMYQRYAEEYPRWRKDFEKSAGKHLAKIDEDSDE